MQVDYITKFILYASWVVFLYFLIFILFPVWTILSVVHNIVIIRKTKNIKKWKWALILGILPMILSVCIIFKFFNIGIGLILLANITSTVLFFVKE